MLQKSPQSSVKDTGGGSIRVMEREGGHNQTDKKTTSEEPHHSQERGNALPADQPTMESFWQTPTTDSTTSTQKKSRIHNKAENFKRLTRPNSRVKYSTINKTTYKSPTKHCSMEDNIQKTPPTGGAPGVQRILQEEEGSASS